MALETVNTVVVQDREYGQDGKPLVNQEVTVRLAPAAIYLIAAGAAGNTDQVALQQVEQRTKTDATGFWSVNLVANAVITPANTYYSVKVGLLKTYDVAIPAGAGPFIASNNLTGPLPIFPGGSSVAGPITITGNLSVTGTGTFTGALAANGGLAVLGGGNVNGGWTIAGLLTMTDAASRLVPGATSFSIRDTANANDNLLVLNNGNVTVRGTLTSGGQLTVSAGGASITGDETLSGRLVMAPASAKIVGGATQLSLRNNADSADNVLVSDAGLTTLRNALNVPASAGGTLPPTSYGTLPMKFDEKTPSGVATVSFNLPSGFRHAHFRGQCRSDFNASAVDLYGQLNADGAADYVQQQFYGNNNVANSVQGTSAIAQPILARIAALTATAGIASTFSVDIENYSGGTFIKEVLAFSQDWESTSAAAEFLILRAFRWNSTLALTSVLFGLTFGNFVTGSVISGYVWP